MISASARLVWQAIRWRALRGGWLLDYLRRHQPFPNQAVHRGAPVDVIVTIVDHFEPSTRLEPSAAVERVESWCASHREVAGRYRDADGRTPQHTWFYRSEFRNFDCLRALNRSTFAGFGEIEFHLHHGFDTHESFSEQLRTGLDWFNTAGAMLTAEREPRRRFAYIAGNWSLDNGTHDDSKSGCNTELIALRETGCYADFTFPALGSSAQPRLSNTLYYATDDPRPKSYDTGIPLAVGRKPTGDLMIFQGPLMVDWRHGRFEGAALESFAPPAPERLDPWLRANVHVNGRPEWVFVKLHTHGLQSRETLFPSGLDGLFAEMTRTWNRPPFRLHFTTAREAFNIAKAAEAGHSGDPNQFRDFDVPQPANRRVACSAPWRLLTWDPPRVSLEILEPGPVEVAFEGVKIRTVRGALRKLDLELEQSIVRRIEAAGAGSTEVEVEIETENTPATVSSADLRPVTVGP
jgi:hypothetical protein